MQEKSNPNQKIDLGSEVKALDLGLSSSIPFRISLTPFKEGKKLVVIQKMSGSNKKIVVDKQSLPMYNLLGVFMKGILC